MTGLSKQYEELFNSLRRRRRPEDIAQLILEAPEVQTPFPVKRRLNSVARHSLKQGSHGFTSMREEFAPVIGCDRQLAKGNELFPNVPCITNGSSNPLNEVVGFFRVRER